MAESELGMSGTEADQCRGDELGDEVDQGIGILGLFVCLCLRCWMNKCSSERKMPRERCVSCVSGVMASAKDVERDTMSENM